MAASSVPTGGAATLSVTLNGSTANSIRIQGLVRTRSGELAPFSRNVTAPSDRVPVTTDIATDVEGDVVACTVEALTAGTKRGQVYAIVQVAVYSVTTALCAGYVYDGFLLTLGKFVEPGPGGGEGNFLLNPVLATTATGADFILDVGPASNAIWKIHEMKIRYTASATVGTRNVRLTRLDEYGVVLYAIADQAPTANQILDYIFTDILIAERSNPIDSNVAVEIQIRQYLLPEGHVFRLEDTGDISATDTVAVFGVIEEWLVI